MTDRNEDGLMTWPAGQLVQIDDQQNRWPEGERGVTRELWLLDWSLTRNSNRLREAERGGGGKGGGQDQRSGHQNTGTIAKT